MVGDARLKGSTPAQVAKRGYDGIGVCRVTVTITKGSQGDGNSVRRSGCAELSDCAPQEPQNTNNSYFSTHAHRILIIGCNSTELASDCPDFPLACTARHVVRFAVELMRLLEQFAFGLPDLVRFNDNGQYETFEALDPTDLIYEWDNISNCLTTWIDQLDTDECQTTTPPFDGWQPNSTLVPITPVLPNAPPLPFTYVCGRDGLAYNYDTSLLIYVTSADGLNRSALTCNPDATTNDCIIASGINDNVDYQLTVVGTPTLENVNIFVAPTVGTDPVPVSFNVSDGYSISMPNCTELADVYNVTNCPSPVTNCTITSLPLPTPLTPGLGCYESSLGTGSNMTLLFRPVELPTTPRIMGQVYDTSTSENVNCTYTYPPQIETMCLGGRVVVVDPAYGSNLALQYVDPFTNLVEFASCDSGSPARPLESMCRYNQLYYLPTGSFGNDTLFFLQGFPSSSIPCAITPPLDWVCNALDDAEAYVGHDHLIYFENNDALTNVSLPCVNNSGTTEPLCASVFIEFGAYGNATVELEGTNVLVYFNSSFATPLTCSVPAILLDESTPPPPAPASFSEHIADVTEAVANMPYPAPGVKAMIYISSNTSLYRKESLICCLSEAIFYAMEFVGAVVLEVLLTVRGVLAKLALGSPTSEIYIPTFSTAASDLQTSLCRLICAATRILPVTFSCEQLPASNSQFKCGNGAECAQSFGCAVVGVLINAVTIFVNVLQTIRSIVNGTPVTSALFGSTDCTTLDKAPSCIADMIVVIIVQVIYSVDAAALSLAGLLDCTICAITIAIDPNAGCTPFIFDFVAPFVNFINTMVANVLPLLVTLFITFVTTVIDIFTRTRRLSLL